MPNVNNSGWRPTEFNVIVEPREVERQTRGGLHLPETVVENDEFRRTEGIIVAMSPMAFSFAEWPDDVAKPRVGQRAMFSQFAGTQFDGKDGKKYWILKDKSIVAVEDQDD